MFGARFGSAADHGHFDTGKASPVSRRRSRVLQELRAASRASEPRQAALRQYSDSGGPVSAQKLYSMATSGVTLSRRPCSSSLNNRFTSRRKLPNGFVLRPSAPLSALNESAAKEMCGNTDFSSSA